MPKRNKRDLEARWKEKWGDPERWEKKAHRGKIGFGLFVLAVGIIWLLRDLGYIQSIPMFPVILIFFAVFVLLTR